MVKSHTRPKMGNEFCVRQKISFLLLSQDCFPARAQVRLLHSYSRTHRVTCPSPARIRSDETHAQASGDRGDPPKIKNKNEKMGNNQATRSRLRDLPVWLQEFTEKLEDTDVPAPANTSHDSDSEHLAKVATRKHSIFLTSQKTAIAKFASEPRRQGLLAGSALAKQYFGQNIW